MIKKVDEKYILSIFHTLIIIQSATFSSLNFVKSVANAKIIGTAKFCMNIHIKAFAIPIIKKGISFVFSILFFLYNLISQFLRT